MYYVTAIQDRRVYWLVGPFDTHEIALGFVETARAEAVKREPFLHFAAFGTARRSAPPFPLGVLNRDVLAGPDG